MDRPDQVAETIAEVTNRKIIEVYRAVGTLDVYDEYEEAARTDAHLSDLSKRILQALAAADYRTGACQVEEVVNKPVLDPDPEKNTPRAASIDPYAELNNVSQTPIDGGGLDITNAPESQATEQDPASDTVSDETTAMKPSSKPISGGELDTHKESNESPATNDRPHAKPPGVDESSVSADRGADPDTLDAGETETETSETGFAERLRQWKEAEGLSNMDIQRKTGVSNVTVLQILNGNTSNPTPATKKKILSAIRKSGFNPKAKTADPEAVNGIEKICNDSHDPADFIRLQLQLWMQSMWFGISMASGYLNVKESVLRSILVGDLPHSNIVHQLARHIPAIQAQEPRLTTAAKLRDAAG